MNYKNLKKTIQTDASPLRIGFIKMHQSSTSWESANILNI